MAELDRYQEIGGRNEGLTIIDLLSGTPRRFDVERISVRRGQQCSNAGTKTKTRHATSSWRPAGYIHPSGADGRLYTVKSPTER